MLDILIAANVAYLVLGIATFVWMMVADPLGGTGRWYVLAVSAVIAILSWPLILWCLVAERCDR